MTVQTKDNTSQLYFDVEKMHVSQLGLNGIAGRDHAVVVRPGEEDKIISLCSETYELVKNDLIFPVIEQQFQGTNFRTKVQNYNDASFSVDYIFPLQGLDFLKDDKLQFRLNTSHSYDKTKKFDVSAGLFRQLCSNGLSVPVQIAAALDFKMEMSGQHTHDNVKGMLENFKTWLPAVLNKFPSAMKDAFAPMHDKKVDDYATRILEVVTATGVFSTKLVEDAVAVAQTEQMLAGLPATDWLTYNAINNLIFSDEVNRKSDWDRRRADQKVLEYMVATV